MKNEIQRLSQTEMQEAIMVFEECFLFCYSKQTPSEKDTIEKFVKNILLRIPVYSLRPDSIDEVNEIIFTSKTLTQFIFDLCFRYFSIAGEYGNISDSLSKNIVDGLLVGDDRYGLNTIPPEISESCISGIFKVPQLPTLGMVIFDWIEKVILKFLHRESPQSFAQKFISSNKHLIIIYLILLSEVDKHLTDINQAD